MVAAGQHPLDPITTPEDLPAIEVACADIGEVDAGPFEVGAADLDAAHAFQPGGKPGMLLRRERDAERADGGEMREQREIGDRKVAADELLTFEVALERIVDPIEVLLRRVLHARRHLVRPLRPGPV